METNNNKDESLENYLKDIKEILNRAYPEKKKGKFLEGYEKFQRIIKYVGIPALILASVLPVYEWSKSIKNRISRNTIINTYREYSSDLLLDGKVKRAEKVLLEVNSDKQMAPTIHYALAKIKVQQQILNPDNLEETEDILQILIRLNQNDNLFTGNYGDESELLSLKVMLAELHITKSDFELAKSTLLNEEKSLKYADNKLKSEYYLKLGTIYVWEHKTTSANIYLTKAKNYLTNIKEKDVLEAEILFQKAKNFQFDREFFKAIDLYNSSLNLYSKNKSKRGLLNTYNNLGMIYYNRLFEKNNDTLALNYYIQATEIAEEINDNVATARAQYNTAIIKRKQGFVEDALQLYILALENFKISQNDYGMAITHSAVGRAYFTLGYTEKAFFHSKKGLDLLVKTKTLNNIGVQAGNIADVYRAIGNTKAFIIYDYLAFVYNRAFNDTDYIKNRDLLETYRNFVSEEEFRIYITDAKRMAKKINIEIGRLDIDLEL